MSAIVRGEDGFSLIEVMVAALILVVGLLATLGALDSGGRLTAVSQHDQRAVSFAQRDIEGVTALPWSHLALDVAPTPATDATPADPVLSGCTATGCTGLDVHQDYARRTGVPISPAEPFVAPDAAGVDPTSSLPDGATIYRYVTWAKGAAEESGHAKRVTVAVVPAGDGSDGLTKPVWSSTIVTDPSVQPLELP